MLRPRPPVLVDPVLDDPELVQRLVLAQGPYWPVYRYFGDAVEARATGAPVPENAPLRVPPWFRQDWADGEAHVEGIEPLLDSPRLARAARDVYGLSSAAILRPQLVYVNLMLPMLSLDPGHTDVPAFRGITRDRHPIWLLSVMGHSGLFERWRIRIATAVSWWYDGEGGALRTWPDGPQGPGRLYPARTNTALVGENELMFHRVERVGGPGEPPPGLDDLSPDCSLVAQENGLWSVIDGGQERVRLPFGQVRISVSWKTEVLADAAEQELVDGHTDDLDLDQVWGIFGEDLRARGIDAEPCADPLDDACFIQTLGKVYGRTPPLAGDPR